MPNLFTWLHLSDIHARHGDLDYRAAQALIVKELAASVRQRPPGLDRVDAIMVTGDLAFSGGVRDPDEYSDVADWLGRLAATLHVPADRIFVVPGNHDVDRGVATGDPAVAAWLAEARRGDAGLRGPSGIRARASGARFAGWRDVIARVAPHLTPRLGEHAGWSFDLDSVHGLPLRLVGLNTALLSQDEADEGALRIGGPQAEPVFEPDRLVLVLGHHPLSWLADPVDLLAPLRRWADVYFHGHVHRQGSHALLDGGGDVQVTVVAGATHLDPRELAGGATAAGPGGPLQHAYGFGAIVGEPGKPLRLRFWPRAYTPDRGFIADARNCQRGVEHAELPLAKPLTWGVAATATAVALPTVVAAPAPMAPAPAAALVRHYRPPLEVYVVWRPGRPEPEELAPHLYGVLHRSGDDPFGHASLDIPVFFRTIPAPGGDRPPPIDLERADATAVIALLDESVTAADGAPYRDYLRDLARACDRAGGPRRMIPVALHEHALRISGLNPVHFVRAYERDGLDRIDAITRGVVHHLARLLRVAVGAGPQPAVPEPVDVFVSHATSDGAAIAERIREFLLDGTGLSAFVDRHDMAVGYRFLAQIDERLADPRAVFLAVLTDDFANSRACLEEIATARRERRPIVAVDARLGPRQANLPLLGHAPVLRWLTDDPDFWRDLLRTILLEALRYAFVPPYLASIESLWRITLDGSLHVPARPDVVDLEERTERLLHTDPPLDPAQERIFHRLKADLTLATPSTLPLRTAYGLAPEAGRFLTGKEIAISISESPDAPLLGQGGIHLEEAMVEFARHVFLHGGTVGYGGDLRQGGFTEQLMAIARRSKHEGEDLVRCHLAWPIHLGLLPARERDLSLIVRFERLAEVTGAIDPDPDLKKWPGPLRFAQNLSAMRRWMAGETHARVVMGGRVAGAQGAMPGLVEEAVMTIDAGKPLFLIGAFGGCASVVWRALTDQPTPELDIDYQRAANPLYQQVVDGYNAWAPGAGFAPIDYPALRARLVALGPTALRNGLRPEENLRLIETPHLPEILALVFLGCQRLFGPRTAG